MDEKTVGLITFVLTGIGTYFTTRWKVRKDIDVEYGRMVREARLRTYPTVWATLQPLALYARHWAVTNRMAWTLAGSLRRWYFEQGGMFLTDGSRDAYFALQRSLGDYLSQVPWQMGAAERELDEDAFEPIRNAGSELRTQLVRDLGTRRTDAPVR
jgi:hypothetical protein